MSVHMPFPSSPVHSNLFRRTASVALHFVVVGASVGGLAAAYNLRQAGHSVHVVEKSSRSLFDNAIGGIRVPPNMMKLLLHWGLEDIVMRTGVKCHRIDFMEGTNGDILSSVIFHDALMRELQAEMSGMMYSDLTRILLNLTVDSGVRVDFDCEVVDIDLEKPYILLKSGDRLHCDMIVGADGPSSIVRRKLDGGEIRAGPYPGYTFSIPTHRMQTDPELREFTKDNTWRLWMGPKKCVLSFLTRKDTYAVQLVWPKKNPALGWDTTVPLSEFDVSEFDPRAQRLFRLAEKATETQHVLQDPMERWFDAKGKAFVLGDAVHFLNPGTSHGAAMAMEDAAVIGSLFSRLRSRNQEEILELLNAYQEIREERCNLITDSEYEKIHFSVLEAGDPIRLQRDAGLKASREMGALDWQNITEEYLKAQWEEYKGSFGYEAYDAADGWWVDWGLLRERLGAASSTECLSPIASPIQPQQHTFEETAMTGLNIAITTTVQ